TEQELDLAPESPQSTPVVSASVEALYDPAIPPRPPIRLVGRDDELVQLKQRLCSGGSIALTALNGLPGVGKTTLAIELSHGEEIRAHFRDGVLWAGLGPDPNLSGLMSRWGTLLGIPSMEMATLSDGEAWAMALRRAIGSRYMLLVIDDAWEIEEALAFKVGGPNCAHLVTTRFPNIAAHFATDGAIMISELSEDESITLLRMLAPGVVDREAKKAHDLVHAVGGLPLALTLMGNYLRKQAYSGQSRRVRAALDQLSNVEERLQISEPRGPVERHPSLPANTPLSLQSVIAVTDQQLNEEARAALYELSVFPAKPNTFSEEAALAVARCPVEVFDTLSDAGLLESSGSGRYTLHQTIADYARVHLKENVAYDRLIAYVINYVEAHKKDYELLEQESSTILAALEAAHELGRQVQLVRGVTIYAPFLLLRGLYATAERLLQRAHEAALAHRDEASFTNVLLYLGEIAQKQGNFAQAEAYFQEGMALARREGNRERISALLTGLGTVSWKRGEYAQAETYLQEGLTLARQIGDPERISELLKTLGSVAAGQGNYVQEEVYLQEGLTLARQLGNREQICVLLMNLGATTSERGNHAQAEAYYQEGLALARQIGYRELTCALLGNLGDIASEHGDYAQAQLYFQEGLALARQIEQRAWVSALLVNLGLTTRKQRNYKQAELYLQESLVLARQIDRPQIIAHALYEYGNLYLDQQRIQAAEAAFHEMLTIIPRGDRELNALARYGLAGVAYVQGNIQEAQKYGEASATALEGMGHSKAEEVRQWLQSIMD
ncbi:MAG: tetratricopeptide repeat protein, partial [Chloroflexi bacterium]|nr:tetratricopeptide repeat protein [Chloroflexota bacterium]